MSITPNEIIRVSGEAGTFKVLAIRPNGDLDVWGGAGGHLPARLTQGHAAFRTFRPERCRVARLSKKARTQLAAIAERVS